MPGDLCWSIGASADGLGKEVGTAALSPCARVCSTHPSFPPAPFSSVAVRSRGGLAFLLLRATIDHTDWQTSSGVLPPNPPALQVASKRRSGPSPCVDLVNEPPDWPLEVLAITQHKAPVPAVAYRWGTPNCGPPPLNAHAAASTHAPWTHLCVARLHTRPSPKHWPESFRPPDTATPAAPTAACCRPPRWTAPCASSPPPRGSPRRRWRRPPRTAWPTAPPGTCWPQAGRGGWCSCGTPPRECRWEQGAAAGRGQGGGSSRASVAASPQPATAPAEPQRLHTQATCVPATIRSGGCSGLASVARPEGVPHGTQAAQATTSELSFPNLARSALPSRPPRQVADMRGHKDTVTAVAVSGDGKVVASGGR